MSEIVTTVGAIAPAQLGVTLMHEHVNYSPYDREPDDNPDNYDWEYITGKATEDLLEVYDVGGRFMVDATPNGAGRNPAVIAEVSRRSGVSIIASTGFLFGVNIQRVFGTRDVDALTEVLVRELRHGMDDTHIRAGLIKLGTSAEMTDDERLAFEVGARAHRETGAGIITHTHLGQLAVEQAQLLIRLGVDPSKLVVGHLLDRPDYEVYAEVARLGAKIGLDRLGRKTKPEAASLDAIARLVKAGYRDSFILSHDSTMFHSATRKPRVARSEQSPDSSVKPQLSYALVTVVARLRERGVPEDVIAASLVDTPRHILAH